MQTVIIRILLAVVLVLGVRIILTNTPLGDYFWDEKEEELQSGEWMHFHSEEDLFEAMLPAKPEIKSETFSLVGEEDTYEYHQYLAQDDVERAYLVRVLYYPNIKLATRERLLDRVVDQVLHIDRDHRLRSARETLFQNRRAIYFTYDDGDLMLANMAVQVGATVYLVTHADRMEFFDQKHFDRLIAGFQLLVEETAP